MTTRQRLILLGTAAVLVLSLWWSLATACCVAPPWGKAVVNADQTVIIVWDAATKTEHFIRQASFKSEADDFGFLVPSPTQPELDESGDEAFPYLLKLTEPEKQRRLLPCIGLSCCSTWTLADASFSEVKVLDEKLVAGFHAVVLEAKSANALVGWLNDHGYAFSPEVEAWAKPYIEKGWKITALKVAKGTGGTEKKTVSAASLRMSFKTDRPLFPYREPDPKSHAAALKAQRRLLRIYFMAEARYRGELTPEVPWTGKVVWANKIAPASRRELLRMLRLPENTGPVEWWLTEFEDAWPYTAAPADLDFSRDANQKPVRRPPVVASVSSPWPTDVTVYALAASMILAPLVRRIRRRKLPFSV